MPQAAVIAASRYIEKCLMMAGSWVSRNPMTERNEYLYLRRQHIDVFAESWAMYRDEWDSTKQD
eukprot:15446903-Alexandrium_andersonii.AAC.2